MNQQTEQSNIIDFPAEGGKVVKADTDEGYTRIANTLLESVYQCELPARQLRTMLAIVRKTYGYNRKTDWITASQVAQEINYSGDHSNIRKDIKALKARKLLLVDGRKVGPNPTVSDWVFTKQVENNTGRKQPANKSKTTRLQVENNPTDGLKTTPTKDNSKNNKKDSNKKKGFVPPDWLNLELFGEYEIMRKAIKKPMTDHAKKLAVTELEKIIKQGYNQDEIINKAILKNWQSFYAPGKPAYNKPQASNQKELDDWVAGDDSGAIDSTCEVIIDD